MLTALTTYSSAQPKIQRVPNKHLWTGLSGDAAVIFAVENRSVGLVSRYIGCTQEQARDPPGMVPLGAGLF